MIRNFLKIYLPFLCITLFVNLSTNPVKANGSLGVSPASLINDHLVPGSKFSQKFTISRNDASGNQTADLSISGSVSKDWFTFSEENIFFAQDEKIQTFTVFVEIPDTTPLGSYSGIIKIELSDPSIENGLNFSPGLSLKVVLDIGDNFFEDLEVTGSRIVYNGNDVINSQIDLLNSGNIPSSVNIVTLKILDSKRNILDEYSRSEIYEVGSFSLTSLSLDWNVQIPGDKDYFCEINVFSKDILIYSDEVSFKTTLKDSASKEDDVLGVSTFDISIPQVEKGFNKIVLIPFFLIIFLILVLILKRFSKKGLEKNEFTQQ